MKRFYAILAAAFAFVGCSQDEAVTPNIPIEKPTYYASFADAEDDSRTYLDENLKLLWHNDDRISLFATTYNEEYAFVDPTGSNSWAFNAVDKDSWVTGNETSTTYAVYPYNAANTLSNSELLTIHFPAEQTYAENSFGRGANTMVAAAESASSKLLPFRNAGGYLMLKLYGENKTVKQIELKGNNEEDCYHKWLECINDHKATLSAKASFNELYEAVKRLKFKGIGDLTIYDTATMLGCPNGVFPEAVYLHAGAAAGARVIGIEGEVVEKSVFTAIYPAFELLEPIQIEDFLCIYKRHLQGETTDSPIGCGGCC